MFLTCCFIPIDTLCVSNNNDRFGGKLCGHFIIANAYNSLLLQHNMFGDFKNALNLFGEKVFGVFTGIFIDDYTTQVGRTLHRDDFIRARDFQRKNGILNPNMCHLHGGESFQYFFRLHIVVVEEQDIGHQVDEGTEFGVRDVDRELGAVPIGLDESGAWDGAKDVLGIAVGLLAKAERETHFAFLEELKEEVEGEARGGFRDVRGGGDGAALGEGGLCQFDQSSILPEPPVVIATGNGLLKVRALVRDRWDICSGVVQTALGVVGKVQPVAPAEADREDVRAVSFFMVVVVVVVVEVGMQETREQHTLLGLQQGTCLLILCDLSILCETLSHQPFFVSPLLSNGPIFIMNLYFVVHTGRLRVRVGLATSLPLCTPPGSILHRYGWRVVIARADLKVHVFLVKGIYIASALQWQLVDSVSQFWEHWIPVLQD